MVRRRAQPDPARRARRRQGHAGAAAGGALRHPADLDRRHAARGAPRGHAARQEGRGVHERGRSSCPTRSSSASSRSGSASRDAKAGLHPRRLSAHHPAGARRSTACSQKLGRAKLTRRRRAGARGDAHRAARRSAVVPQGRRVVPRQVHAAEGGRRVRHLRHGAHHARRRPAGSDRAAARASTTTRPRRWSTTTSKSGVLKSIDGVGELEVVLDRIVRALGD